MSKHTPRKDAFAIARWIEQMNGSLNLAPETVAVQIQAAIDMGRKDLLAACEAALPWLRIYADNVVDGDAYKRARADIERIEAAIKAAKE